jgi:hypothetical protein
MRIPNLSTEDFSFDTKVEESNNIQGNISD